MLTAFLVTAIDLLGFGIVLPLVPRLRRAVPRRHQRDAAKGVVIGLLYQLVLADAVRLRADVGPACRTASAGGRCCS